MANHELEAGIGHAPGINPWKAMERPVSCPKTKTGSCRGCEVLYSVYKVADEATLWRPRSAHLETRQAANVAANTRCPVGLRPDTSLIKIRVTRRGLGDTVGSARLRGR